MRRRPGSGTTSGGSATLENSRNTIPRGNFGTVRQKSWKKFIAQLMTARESLQPGIRRAFLQVVGIVAALGKHFLRNVENQKRIGDVIHRSKMLSQPSVLLRTPINSNQGVDRDNNSTCVWFTRIYDNLRMTADILG